MDVHMTMKDWTPEQRSAFMKKAAEAKRAKRARRERPGTREPVLIAEADDTLGEVEVAKPIKLPTTVEEDVFDGLLTDAEKAELDAAAKKRARDDQKKAAKTAYAKDALDRARREIGEMPADEEHRKWLEEAVRVYVDMPRLRKPTGGEHDPEPIIIDQQVYASGRFYEVTRARGVYLQYLMDQARRHVNQVDGRSRTYYNPNSFQTVYQGGAAMGGGSLGTSFDALHKRPA
jgi:hypothetical protein